MTDTPAMTVDEEAAWLAAWERDGEAILMATLGRAEHHLNTDPLTQGAMEHACRTELGLLALRAAMMASIYELRQVLRECGWWPEQPPTKGVPDHLKANAEQTLAVYRDAGMVP